MGTGGQEIRRQFSGFFQQEDRRSGGGFSKVLSTGGHEVKRSGARDRDQ
jgi:hypothetical protein